MTLDTEQFDRLQKLLDANGGVPPGLPEKQKIGQSPFVSVLENIRGGKSQDNIEATKGLGKGVMETLYSASAFKAGPVGEAMLADAPGLKPVVQAIEKTIEPTNAAQQWGKSSALVGEMMVPADIGARLLGRGASSIKERAVSSIQPMLRNLNPKTSEEAVNALYRAYDKSFTEGSGPARNMLDKVAAQEKTTREQLLRNLAEEGYVPEVDGKFADFRPIVNDLSGRQMQLIEAIDPFLRTSVRRTDVDFLKAGAEKVLREKGASQYLDKSLRELERFVESIRTKYGDSLTDIQVNQIRKDMNKTTKAFKGEFFEQDAADALADIARSRLDELSPEIRNANKEWMRLQKMKRTARVLTNKTIDVGLLGDSTGRYIAATALGASGLATGAGSLVIAGIAAHLGGEAFANFLRKQRFSSKLRNTIIQDVRKDEAIRNYLLETAEGENKAMLERLLLPEGSVRLPPQQGQSSVKVVPAQKIEGGGYSSFPSDEIR